MSPTEQMLRAALAWARFRDESGYLVDKIPHTLDFIPSGPVKVLDRTTQRPHLHWMGDGRLVTVSTTPGGRVLHVVDAYLDRHSATTEMRLPREFWTQSAVKDSLTARPNTERRSYVDLGDTGSAEEESGW